MIFKITPPRIRQLAAFGVVLSLLCLGCERDEAPGTSTETLTQQQAMNLFFKSYRSKQDTFRDAVVNSLLAMNDSTNIIPGLTAKYGQPRWEVEQSQSPKSGTYLVVPVSASGQDSVSAVFAFVDSLGRTYLKIFEANSPDTLTADFVLYYQCALYPRHGNPERIAVPHELPGKGSTVVETCWDVYTSVDHGATLTFRYTHCSSSMVNTSPAVYDLGVPGNPGNNGDSDDSDPDGGGDFDPNNPEEEGCARPTLYEEYKDIQNTRGQISKRDHCASNKIIDSTKNVRYEIDPCMETGTYGEYEYNSNEVQFRDASEVNEARLYEELMHAYQNQFYQGLSKYGPGMPGFTNMEFEAKVMYAIYWYQEEILGDPVLFQGLNETEKGIFINWIEDIVIDGFTSDVLSQYDTIIDIFNRKNPSYAGFISSTFPKLSVIQNLLNGCPKTY